MATIKGFIPDWRYPESSERALARQLQQATQDSVVLMREKLDRLKFDATDDEISDAESDLEDQVIAIFLALVAALPSIARTIYQFNSQQWLIIAKASGGEANPAVALLSQTGALEVEPWYQNSRSMWQTTAQNSIVKLARDIVADWSTNVRTQAMRGATRKKVDDVIGERYAIYGSWSKNRASGIIGSFNSMLMKQRIRDAGVSKYIWKGKMDDRERLKHVLLQNAVRELDGDGIFPGEEYGCRCWAVPSWS